MRLFTKHTRAELPQVVVTISERKLRLMPCLSDLMGNVPASRAKLLVTGRIQWNSNVVLNVVV